jgi:general secretion pathway protein D
MKTKRIIEGIATIMMIASPFYLSADPATPEPFPSHVQTELRLEIDKKTNMVHFINTNNDPDIITKTYVLKHADPYELRPYLRSALGAERVTGDGGKVEAVKYNDGTGVLLVSAEDYKFDRDIQNGGMTIDDIVELLDKPKITSSSGKNSYLYFPKHRTADELVRLLRNSGMSIANSVQENQRGKDQAFPDEELNAIWFYVTNWSVKYINDMLKIYDQPLPEVKVTYKIFEIDKENDDKIGADWQAWKNGPGSDFFTGAARHSRGWDFSQNMPGLPNVGKSHTQFLKFSPRWNSRFLDLVAAKGRAEVLTEGQITLVNEEIGRIEALTQFPSFVPGAANDPLTLLGYVRYTNCAMRYQNNQIQIDVDLSGNFDVRIDPVDMKGNRVEINVAATGQNLLISRVNDGDRVYYYMKLQKDLAAQAGLQFIARGYGNIGTDVRCTGDFSDGDIDWQSDRQYIIQKDNDRNTQVNDLITQGDTFGFHLSMIPSVCGQATTLDINIYNTSLIGFQNNGTPRTERSEFNTKVMLANNGSRFVIGGIEKKTTINSVSKVPWLGSIPLLGWLLGSESAVGKNVRIVSVLECVPVFPDSTVPAAIQSDFNTIGLDTKESGFKNNNIGFDQFHLDKNKRSLHTLP